MFVKIFSKIFDSTIAENWQARVVFMDLLILADRDGVVDMTPAAIARRTNCPLEFVKDGIALLCEPDPSSRTEEDDGKRLELIDGHRDWGWRIINYKKYRDVKSSEELRAKNRERVKRYRERHSIGNEDDSITTLPSVSSAYASEHASASVDRGGAGGERISSERIRMAYPRRDAPLECDAAIHSAISSGEDSVLMLEQVRECAAHMARAPGGHANSLLPSAKTFFSEGRWRQPEVIKSRVDDLLKKSTNGSHQPKGDINDWHTKKP